MRYSQLSGQHILLALSDSHNVISSKISGLSCERHWASNG